MTSKKILSGRNAFAAVQEKTLEDLTIYVRAAGDDTDDGLTAGTAKASFQAAFDLICDSEHVITVDAGPGTFIGQAKLTGITFTGDGCLKIQGTKALAILDGSNAGTADGTTSSSKVEDTGAGWTASELIGLWVKSQDTYALVETNTATIANFFSNAIITGLTSAETYEIYENTTIVKLAAGEEGPFVFENVTGAQKNTIEISNIDFIDPESHAISGAVTANQSTMPVLFMCRFTEDSYGPEYTQCLSNVERESVEEGEGTGFSAKFCYWNVAATVFSANNCTGLITMYGCFGKLSTAGVLAAGELIDPNAGVLNRVPATLHIVRAEFFVTTGNVIEGSGIDTLGLQNVQMNNADVSMYAENVRQVVCYSSVIGNAADNEGFYCKDCDRVFMKLNANACGTDNTAGRTAGVRIDCPGAYVEFDTTLAYTNANGPGYWIQAAGRLVIDDVGGAANGTWGLQIDAKNCFITNLGGSDITGTSGDFTLNDSDAHTWAGALAAAGDFVENVDTHTRIEEIS